MPDAYDVKDGRYVQCRTAWSAANGLTIACGAGVVPAGKVRTYISALISGTVAESQIFWFAVQSATYMFPVTTPATFQITPAQQVFYPLVREGMEIKLFPGETLYALRQAATAGSGIGIYSRFIDVDLPYYSYEDPLKKVIQKRGHGQLTHGGTIIGGSMIGSGGHGESGGGGGGGTPPPV